MIKSLPLSYDEQSFLAKSISSGVANGGMYMGSDVIGLLGFVGAFIFTLTVIRRKSKNKLLDLILKLFLAVSIISMFIAFLSFDPMTKITGLIDFWTNLSQLAYLIAMIINEPSKWWRTLLLAIPGLVIPKAIQNVFRKRPWHFSSIGKIFGNMYAGFAFSVIGTIILVMTGKSQKRIEQEQRQQQLQQMRQ